MTRSIPSVSVNFLQHTARQSNELGMRRDLFVAAEKATYESINLMAT